MITSDGQLVAFHEAAKPKVPVGTQSVPALQKAFSILEILALSRGGLSLPQIVKKSGLPKSSVHCILVTLQRQQYLYRDERTGRYMFGVKLVSLAKMALGPLHLREQAAPNLYSLAQQTKLTTHMAIREQNEAVVIAKVDGSTAFRVATWLGKRMDLHCTGLGKALIAHLPEKWLDELVQRLLPRHNENTIVSARRLKEDLANTIKRGYAIDDEEDEIGLRCIGAAVFDHSGAVIAAISISGTTIQITPENVHNLATRVTDKAAAISRVLGFNSSLAC